jgi:hypothetical protein
MRKTALPLTLFATMLVPLLHTMPAQAQNTRSFVAPTGSDGNNCSLATPCRTFAGAISKTNSGGEIDILGTAGYGSFTIDRAISIVNPGGVEAGIAVGPGANGITINAGPNDIVSLRGLTLEGAGIGQNAIVFNTGARLEILDCMVRNFADVGVYVHTTTAAVSLLIANTRVLDTPHSAGIYIVPQTNSLVLADIDHATVSNNNYGIYLDASGSAGIFAKITNSIVDNFANTGIAVVGGGNATGNMFAYIRDSSVFSFSPLNLNTIGVSVSTGSFSGVWLYHVMVVGIIGVKMSGGSFVISSGDNDLSASNTPVQGGTLAHAAQQ